MNRKSVKKKNKYLIGLIILSLVGVGVTLSCEDSKKSKLDKYYLERFKSIKSRMIYGSSADSEKDLNDYHDQTELCMHQDGYTGPEIMEIRIQAFREALLTGKQ